MEAQSALVGADGAVHLDAEAAIHFHVALALVSEPAHAKHTDSFGLCDAFQNFGFAIFGMALQHGPQGLEHFKDSLVEFWFGRILGLDEVENLIDVVRRSIIPGRFHDSTHNCLLGLPPNFMSEFYVMTGLSKCRTPQEFRRGLLVAG